MQITKTIDSTNYSKVKFMCYKEIYNKLQPGEVTYYVNKIYKDLRTGIKALPLPIGYLSLASKSSPHKTTIEQHKHLSETINLLVENQADYYKYSAS